MKEGERDCNTFTVFFTRTVATSYEVKSSNNGGNTNNIKNKHYLAPPPPPPPTSTLYLSKPEEQLHSHIFLFFLFSCSFFSFFFSFFFFLLSFRFRSYRSGRIIRTWVENMIGKYGLQAQREAAFRIQRWWLKFARNRWLEERVGRVFAIARAGDVDGMMRELRADPDVLYMRDR